MKVKISENCIGCMTCVQTVPSVFRLNENEKAQVYGEILDSNLSNVEEAMANCPVAAIYFE